MNTPHQQPSSAFTKRLQMALPATTFVCCCSRFWGLAVVVHLIGTQLTAQTHHTAPLGGAGGQVKGGSDTVAEITTGGAIEGGVFEATAGVQDKAGYTGQLYNPTSLALVAPASEFPEENSLQLGATARLDDETGLVLAGGQITWSVESGPLDGIDASGIAQSSAVFEDSPAVARGAWSTFAATLGLTVTDTLADNFGSYAKDEISDGWQVAFFGVENPDAAALADPDGDGQENRFEFLAFTDPKDPASWFSTQLDPGGAVRFSPVSPLRTYTLFSSPDLRPSTFDAVSSVTTFDLSGERTIVDLSPPPLPDSRRFYRILISTQPE